MNTSKTYMLPANWKIAAISRAARERGLTCSALMAELALNSAEHDRILKEYRNDYLTEREEEAARIAAAKKDESGHKTHETLMEKNWPVIEEGFSGEPHPWKQIRF